MKNILFIGTYRYFANFSVVPPLGLMYLASSVRDKFKDAYKIKLVDMKIHKMSDTEIRKIIIDFHPDIIALSVCTIEDKCMHVIADMAKQLNAQCKVIVGGPHSTMYYKDILRDENVDVAVLGEGEETFCELLKSYKEKIDMREVQGIVYKKGTKLIVTDSRRPIPDLDRLPFPAWDLIDVERYSSPKIFSMNSILAGKRYMGIFSSRGCPYHCLYCHNIFGKSYRMRRAENVVREISEVHYRYNVDEIHIFDDIFNFDIKRAKRICDLIVAEGMKINIAFPNALRGDLMDEELILKLKQAGAYMITYALETASPRLQKMLKKNINIAKLKEIIKFTDKQGLLTKCYFMLGLPTETLQEMKKTVDFACSSPLTFASFFILTPQKETEMYKLIKKYYPSFEVNFSENNYYTENGIYERLVGLPLGKLQNQAYRKFFLNPIRQIKLLIRVPRKVYLLRLIYIFFARTLWPAGKFFNFKGR